MYGCKGRYELLNVDSKQVVELNIVAGVLVIHKVIEYGLHPP